jgi:hypothetical protein
MSSVCGSVSSVIDREDEILNPHGVICCDACNSIVSARESWAKVYDYNFIPKCSTCLGKSKVDIANLCENHYNDWFAEKSLGENW